MEEAILLLIPAADAWHGRRKAGSGDASCVSVLAFLMYYLLLEGEAGIRPQRDPVNCSGVSAGRNRV